MTQLVPNHWKKTDRNGSCKRIIHSPDPKLLLMLEIERESHSIYRKFFFSITWHHCVIAMRWMQSLTYPMLSMNDKVKQSFALLWLMADQLCTLYGCVYLSSVLAMAANPHRSHSLATNTVRLLNSSGNQSQSINLLITISQLFSTAFYSSNVKLHSCHQSLKRRLNEGSRRLAQCLIARHY